MRLGSGKAGRFFVIGILVILITIAYEFAGGTLPIRIPSSENRITAVVNPGGGGQKDNLQLYTFPGATLTPVAQVFLIAAGECVMVSDTSNTLEDGSHAQATYVPPPPQWPASILGATWIWSSYFVENPGVDETKTFKKAFYTGKPTRATLSIAADTEYWISLNGAELFSKTGSSSAIMATKTDFDLTKNIKDGSNTLSIKVKNLAHPGQTPNQNPAGLLYKLSVMSKTCYGGRTK